ncbi:MAG: cation:proton antiporter [Phycisphaerales bacterium]|nr:cation:proton antiporter [Phycisphaerales bacterium]
MEFLAEGFGRVAAMLGLVSVLGAIALLLRQPLVVAFLVAGVLAGPSVLGWSMHAEEVELLGELGIAILLFLVGLRLDVSVIRTMGPIALICGFTQVVITTVLGFALGLLLGLNTTASIYVGVALAFSSTIIIVKLLSDRRELSSLHGQLAVGVLIVQDIVVIAVLIVLATLGNAAGDEGGSIAWSMVRTAAVAIVGAGILAAAMRYAIPFVTRHLAKSTELLLLAAIAWAVGLAAGAKALGLSNEVGAFVAGVSLASTPFREAIGNRLVPLRDFMLVFFFLDLGAGLKLDSLGEQIVPAIVLSAFVLIGKPLIVMVIVGLAGYRKHTSFSTGVTLGQISEFSLIMAALGVTIGHIEEGTLALITLVAIITIAASTYGIVNIRTLYEPLRGVLGIFERPSSIREIGSATTAPMSPQVILVGLGRYGGRIGRQLIARGFEVFAVDFDPKALRDWLDHGRAGQYGDITDPEFCSTLPLHDAKVVVCSAPELRTNMALLDALKTAGYEGTFVATAHNRREARTLRRSGAGLVLEPFANAAHEAADKLEALAGPPPEASSDAPTDAT